MFSLYMYIYWLPEYPQTSIVSKRPINIYGEPLNFSKIEL